MIKRKIIEVIVWLLKRYFFEAVIRILSNLLFGMEYYDPRYRDDPMPKRKLTYYVPERKSVSYKSYYNDLEDFE